MRLTQTEPLFESLMVRIEDLFRTKKLRAGSRLPPEKELAATLGVSRHTLREALKALNLFGIIRSRPGDGTYVRRSPSIMFAKAVHHSLLFELANAMDLLDARTSIEPTLARLACERAGRPEIDRMRRAIQGMESSLGDLDSYLEHEIRFHNEIMHAADSPILKAIMEALADQLLLARQTITREQTDRHSFTLHLRILEAIEAGDPDLAFQRMFEHMLDNHKHYRKFFGHAERVSRRRIQPLAHAVP